MSGLRDLKDFQSRRETQSVPGQSPLFHKSGNQDPGFAMSSPEAPCFAPVGPFLVFGKALVVVLIQRGERVRRHCFVQSLERNM